MLPTAAYGAIVKVECLNLGRLHPDSDGQVSPATVAGPAKKEKAEKLGVRMITEDEFARMLRFD